MWSCWVAATTLAGISILARARATAAVIEERRIRTDDMGGGPSTLAQGKAIADRVPVANPK